MSFRRLKITVAYDGRPWKGWQSQVGGHTVQDQMEAALRDLTGQTFGYEYWRATEGRQEPITKWRAWATEQGYQLAPRETPR